MLWGGSNGGLEVRTSADGATRLRGRFPYGTATLLQGGRDQRREVFEARAFGASISAGGDVHLLIGHDFDRPLASRSAGTLDLIDDDQALNIEATIATEIRGVSYVADFLGTLAAGLVKGLSPGFRVPQGGDLVRRDRDGLLRVVRSADLIEISAVTKPAYPQAQIEARSWDVEDHNLPGIDGLHRTLNRWRA
jgi:HK97 family phage prohead protease